jgi:flagellin-like protein
MGGPRRGVSPVIGVLLIIVITILLASIFAVEGLRFGEDLGGKERQFEDAVETMSGNPWSGNRGDLVRVTNNRAGVTDVTYRVNFTIRPGSDTVGNSLNSVYLEVTTGSPDMFSNTELADLKRVGVDEGSDGTIDQYITDDVDSWQIQNGGAALKIGFSGSAYTASPDDSVIVIFEGVENPSDAGEYDLRAETSGDGNWHYGTVTIRE